MRKIVYPLFYIAAIFLSTACKKSFLEVVPQGDQVAVTTHDYDLLMNDPMFYRDTYSGGWQEPVLMGDEVALEAAFISPNPRWSAPLFQWQAIIYKDGEPTPALNNFLTELYTLNKIINEVMASTEGTDTDKKRIQGEAKATRAWVNFQLINYYAKPYAAATAGTDPGFPAITGADVNNGPYSRGTVQEMYDLIVKDLSEAIAVLPAQPVIQTRMCKPAAEGLLGKVYLFMGRNTDALPLLNAAFNDLAGNSKVTLYDYNQAFAPGGPFLPIDPTNGPNGPGNNYTDLTESVVSKVFLNSVYVNGTPLGTDGLVLTPAAQALYGAGDLRLLLYTSDNPDGSPNAGGRLRKYGVRYSRYGLQLPELYLLRAEVKARTNDLAGARADLETLRSHRMPAADAAVPAAVAGSQNMLIRFVIDERIREFAMEGYRWFDMRRLSVDPLFAGMKFTHTQYNVDGTTTLYNMDQPNRLTLRIPPAIIDGNKGMENNP